jgi:putative membrane protein insertion efficiency factor
VKYVLIGLLKVWRLVVSPLYGNVCRYYPSCSAYALRAVEYHGAVKGSWYAARRLLRCHPWSSGGYDPVRGTPECDEEMRVQSRTAATMDTSPTRDSDLRGRVSEVSDGHQTRDELPHRHRAQGRAVTVAQVRGVK